MKSLAAVLALASLAAAAAPPEQRPVQDLRQSLRQYTAGTAAPRQLTPVERAELRRQITEIEPPPAKRRR